jgi:hypothetical protein
MIEIICHNHYSFGNDFHAFSYDRRDIDNLYIITIFTIKTYSIFITLLKYQKIKQ